MRLMDFWTTDVIFRDIYLLLAEFSVRTVNYGPSFFFPSIYGPSAKIDGKKTRIRNLQYGPKTRG